MIIDGRAIASDILAEVRKSVAGYTPTVRAITLEPSSATESYLRIKKARAEEAGMRLEIVRLPEDATEEICIAAISAEGADVVIVQLPLPGRLSLQDILRAIPLSQDADVLSPDAYQRFVKNMPGALLPPVASAVVEILTRNDISLTGKNVVVVGKGQLVGKPCAEILMREGASVTVIDKDTQDPKPLFRAADIIVSGVGKTHLITPGMVKEGVVLIDAGTSDADGAVAGDIDPACKDKALLFTPVPGGVGPIAVACLFKNTAQLVAQNRRLA